MRRSKPLPDPVKGLGACRDSRRSRWSVRVTSCAVAAVLFLTGVAAADPLQDRLDSLTQEISRLALAAAKGEIDPDFAGRQLEVLAQLENDLRLGTITPDDLTLRWQDQGDLPLKGPGARLIAVGVPAGFSGLIRAFLEEGRALDLYAEVTEDHPDQVQIYVPDHPDGPDATDIVTVYFDGAGSLRFQLAPQLDVPDALPRLMQVAIDDLVRDLAGDGVQAETLVAQFRSDPTVIPPRYGYAAAALYIWSEAGRGDPVFRFLRSGVLEGPVWDGLGGTRDSGALNRVYSKALQNSGVLDRLMRVQPERIDKISFTRPDAAWSSPYLRVKSDPPLAAPPPETVTIKDLSSLLLEGRAREYNRTVVLQSAKDAQKLYSVTAFEPVTMTSAALVGGVLTMIDKHMIVNDYDFPTSMAIEGVPVPGDVLLADDDRKVFPEITIVAKGPPYEVKVFADGLDAMLGAVDIATSTLTIAKGVKAIGQTAGIVTKAQRARQRMQAARDNAEDILVGLGTTAVKDSVELTEKKGDALEKGSFDILRVPGRTWNARIEPRSHRNHVSLGYNGEVRWDVRDYHALACWKNTQEGIRATVTTKPEAFAGLFDRKDFAWGVQDPRISLGASPSVLRPGQSARVTAQVSGANRTTVSFEPPTLGDLADIGDFDALYAAPQTLDGCREFVSVTASFPTTGARICHPAPKASVGIVIAQGDGLIRTPDKLTCRDGEVLGFTVAHPENADVMCRLSGPGTLTMAGNEGLLDCPVKPAAPSSITCYTGPAPGQCSPVIPIKRVYPDYAVTAMVTADRRKPLNDRIERFFDECGIENMTDLALDLLEGGSGEARELPVEPVSNPCVTNLNPPASGGGLSGSGGGSAPSAFEGYAEGRFVANWPLGQGRDVSVSDAHSYRYRPYDPGRGPGDRSVLVTSDITASIEFDGPERFVVTTSGSATASSVRTADETPDPDGAHANWEVWRRIEVNRDTELSVRIETNGAAQTLVQALPTRLVNNVPVALLSGFDQNLTSVMMVGNATAAGLIGGRSDWSSAILPGPRHEGETLTYLLLFNGRVNSAPQGEDTTTTQSRTIVDINISPAAPEK